MTAIVGVLNKHGAAIAADSAVTMGNTHKVVNSANKIFTLSKYHPVAVMTYNNASFMGTPWDIIIKEYRKQLKDQWYPKLKDYVYNFIDFLHARNFFCDEDTQKSYMLYILSDFYDRCCRRIVSTIPGVDASNIPSDLINRELAACLAKNRFEDKCPDLSTYTLDDFRKIFITEMTEFARDMGLTDVDLLTESYYHYYTSTFSQSIYTGLVFVGYGESEIYPSIYPVNVCSGFDKRLKYSIDINKLADISEHGSGAVIVPFAQTDVTNTIIRGINPSFLDIIYSVVSKSFEDYSKAITDVLDMNPNTVSISNAVKKIDRNKIINNITQKINDEMMSIYSKPLIDTVVSLDKEDMANMAESFISLTSLVRRMQPGEETVGGPVDVAFISKGDGFVWINRKHYFKPELNAPFFSNYFR